MDLNLLKYPIGEYQPTLSPDETQLNNWIADITSFPTSIEQLVNPLNVKEKHWKYRPGSWNIMQLVHHCADSHMNSFIRFKLALTEKQPAIKPYEEGKWAELIDSKEEDLTASLLLLKGLHRKWAYLLSNLTTVQFESTYLHPADKTVYTLEEATAIYSWHCRHHLAHIEQAIAAKGIYN